MLMSPDAIRRHAAIADMLSAAMPSAPRSSAALMLIYASRAAVIRRHRQSAMPG
jgi:hypothetical protein